MKDIMYIETEPLQAANAGCTARQNMQAEHSSLEPELQSHCDIIWDGLLCWSRALPGQTLTLPCPPTLYQNPDSLSDDKVATKHCTDNGTWYRSQADIPWTNFSLCRSDSSATTSASFDEEDIFISELLGRWFPIVKMMSRIGYAVSLVTLIIAIIVLATNKKLRCPRNTLHMHLFVSFLLRASTLLLKDFLFVEGVGLPSDVRVHEGHLRFDKHNNWECKLVVSAWQYSILANYSWILMEGLYLHRLIFQALFSDTCDITVYIFSGWGLPFLFVVPWIVARAQWDDSYCWTTNPDYRVYMLIKIPIIVAVLISFVLFVNIVRVLLLKLRDSRHGILQRRHVRYRRWAKSTLILVPLFGVHYTVFLVMSCCMDKYGTAEIVWLFCDQLFGSFQGCVVALLYCLLNAEVRCEIRRKWRSWWSKGQSSRASSVSSVGQAALEMGTRHQPTTNETTCQDVGEYNRTPRQSADAPLQTARVDNNRL